MSKQMQTAPTAADAMLDALRRWVRQRPGLEFGNYGNVTSYRSELRSITQARHDFDYMTHWLDGDTVDAGDLREAFRAYSGRLTPTVTGDDTTGYRCELDYTTGQYWPVEYRRAACAVVADLLWRRQRDSMEPGDVLGKSVGTRLRQSFRRTFGIGIARRWFDYGG